MKSVKIKTTKMNLSQTMLRLLMVLLVLPMAWVSAWAWGSYWTYLRTYSDEPEKGLVFAEKTKSSSVPDGSYKNVVASDRIGGSSGAKQSFYGWAKPTRGFKFSDWVAYDYSGISGRAANQEGGASFPSPKQKTGSGDLIYAASWSGGNGFNDVYRTAKASFVPADHYTVTYKEPEGGNYSVQYTYLTTKQSGSLYVFDSKSETLSLSPGSGDKKPYGLTNDDHENGYSYAADVVILSTEATNFIGWYEEGSVTPISTENPFAYSITKDANIVGKFKSAVLSVADNEIKILSTSSTADNQVDLVVNVDAIGSWSVEDFAVTKQNESGSGAITVGTLSYSAGSLTIPLTYNANGYYNEGTSVDLRIGPVVSSYAESIVVSVSGVAEELFSYEARVLDGETVKTTGTVAEALAYINDRDWEDAPTLQLVQKNDNQEFVNATSVLRVKKSMILDLNSQVLKSTTLDNLILVQGNTASDKVNLTITDNSYLKIGEIEAKKSANAVVEAIKVADANKLTMKYIKVSAENTAAFASNDNAKAYGVHIAGTGNVIVLKKANAQEPDVRVSAKSDHDARGVFAEGGYATFQNIAITADANADAYAFHSNATSNISDAALTATTATGANAYAATIAGGTTILDRVALKATSASTSAYGANVVAAGRLVMNGGSVSATATSSVFGVCVQSGATANIQVKTNIEATSTTGADAYGVRNLGTLTLNNITVTATSATNKATAVESITSAASTTIEDGTYTAISATGSAYGLHHQYGTLNVDGGTFTAEAAGNSVYGGRAAVNATIANATFSGETTGSGNTAYGFVSGVAGKNISLTNCTIKAKSGTSGAYALYSRANTTIIGCALEAKTSSGANAWGLYAENGTNTLTNTEATVEAYTTGAYGVDFQAGSLTVNGGTYNVTARQAPATKVDPSNAYGVKVADGKTVTLTNAIFNVTASNVTYSQKAYGAYTGTGTINSTGCTYDVSVAKEAYGIWGDASSTINLQNNIITATAATSGTAYGIYSNSGFGVNGDKITANAVTYPAYTLYFDASAHGDVLGGKFKASGTSTKVSEIIAPIDTLASAANVHVIGGLFYDIPQLRYYVPNTHDIYGVDPAAPEYAEGYYYNVNDHLPYENVCHITEVNRGFPTLAEAFDYARNHSGSTYNIIMTQPYTLLAGNYSLPANATLVVPDKVSRTIAKGSTPDVRKFYTDIVRENRCLTFASGVNLDVYGKIEVSAQQYAFNVGQIGYVPGPYGRIEMKAGSTITLNNGAEIFAWGYITGQGEIRVKSGAKVHEDFQLGDMKGANDMTSYWLGNTNKNTYKVFPITQYYIQNVEAPTKYYYGSELLGSVNYLGSSSPDAMSAAANGIKVVGTEESLFLVTTDDESSWVRKTYDPSTDRIIWETNSSANLGELNISLSGYSMESKYFVLPITNNMTVHALSGLLGITQNTMLLPGAEFIVDKTATLQIKEKDPQNNDMGLYLYDKSQWSTDATPILYSPSWTNGVCPRSKAYGSMKDAAIYVKGKIEVDGYIYTTAGGAAIYSDNTNAGTIEFNKDAAADGTLYKKYDGSVSVPVTSAKLRNGGENGPDANMTVTKGNAEKGDTYAYTNISGSYQWTKLKDVDGGCIIADETDSEHPVYYAKPQGYVAITSETEDENHLFHSVEGSRLFINMPSDAGCQWWEVTETSPTGVYHCATNGTYYKYNTTSESWEEYTVKVTFYFTDPKDDAANKKKVLTVNYGARPDASIVSNPSKTEDAAATYQFYGWKSSNTGAEYSYTAELESVTEDMYYLPVFTSITKKYTVTFKDARNGTDVPVEVFYGAHPACDSVKEPTAQYTYYFQYWLASDETTQYLPGTPLPVVTGPGTTYTAVWTQTVNKYSVIWKNGDDVLETDTKQAYGTAVSYDGAVPTKETDNNYVYTFDGWSLSEGGAKLASLPAVSGDVTYYAHYTTTPRYKVTFANYDGSELYHEFVTQGELPTYNGLTPGRARDLDGYFRFIGWKNSDGDDFAPNATLPAVSGKETYTAQYDYVTELYEITLNNIDGAGGTWSYKFGVGSTPFYDRDKNDVAVEPSKASTAQYEYPFDHWLDAADNEYALNELPAVTEAATYTAVFGQNTRKYNITFANLDGNGAKDSVIVEYGQTPACPVEPAKGNNDFTYDFTGWSPAITSVTGNATYTATFSSTGTPRTFPITFDPDNGVDAPYVLNVVYGHTPTTSDPTKAADVANTYTFSGWSPALTAVTGPAEYTAQYTPTVRKYTITFVNYDGSTVKSTDVAYNTMPTAPSENPTKPLDTELMKFYTFTGWSPSIAIVSGDATYTAQYSEGNIVATVTTAADVTSYHSSWASAIETANADEDGGCTLKLYANISNPSNNTVISKNMTIDLNGYTLSLVNANDANNPQLLKVNNVALTINDSQGNGQIYYKNTAAPASNSNTSLYCRTIYVTGASGSVTINGGTIKAGATGRKSSGGWFSSTYYYANAVAIYVNGSNATTPQVTINGGELIATETYNNNSASGYAVYFDNASNGHVDITGGKFQGKTDIFYNGGADRVTASAATETCYFSKDPGSITVVDGYEKRTPAGISGYTHKVVRVYTVTFQNRGGAVLQNTPKYEAGETPAYSGETPTYEDNESAKLYTFRAWKAEGDANEYTTSFPAVTNHDITYVAQYDEVEVIEITDNTPMEKDVEVTNTVVSTTGVLNTNGKTLTTTNLILKASESASGQIMETSTIVADNVYYDLALYTEARHWHAFGVPWAVDLNENPLTEVETGRTLTLGSHYEIVYYDSHTRATEGPGANCWKYLKHYDQAGQPIDVLTPGKGYMIAFTGPAQTVRFVKKSGAPVIFDGSVTVTAEGEGTDKGINAIANPMAYHANLNVAGVGQVHDGGEIGSDGYDPVTISNMSYIVGKTVYVQVDDEQTITPTNGISKAAAPARRAAKATDKKYMELEDYYTVELTNADGVGSKLYVLPEEDKEDKYVIGHDLVKMGMSTKKAQIWVNRYGANLGLNTTALIYETAEFPMNLYAPAAGEYTLDLLAQPDDDYIVYLTQNGEAIWNLSDAPYALSLPAGVNKTYGLRLNVRKTPTIATGMDEAVVDAKGDTKKVIIDDKVFIIRGNNVYTADGQLVK